MIYISGTVDLSCQPKKKHHQWEEVHVTAGLQRGEQRSGFGAEPVAEI